MQEIELKFQVPAGRRRAVEDEVAGPDRPPRMRLQAAYHDTAARDLAAAGLALRVRREGRRWVQTLKGAAEDGMTRAEHNVVRQAPAGAVPEPDPALHAATPVGERLLKVLHDAPEPALVCLYRTDIWRRTRPVSTPAGEVELAFDHGTIVAGERRLPVCELEIELKQGSPRAVIDTARDWVLRHGLWLDTRTKAERGDMLSRGETVAPERSARPVALKAGMTPLDAWRAVLRNGLDQVCANASQIAAGDYRDEHVHQLRVGLRRLRTAFRFFDAGAAESDLAGRTAALFRRFGAARDQAAVVEPLLRQLASSIDATRLDIPVPQVGASGVASDPVADLHDSSSQVLLLDLLARTLDDGDAAGAPAPSGERRPCAACWRGCNAGTAGSSRRRKSSTGDDVERHALRKRAKRLRYAVEFAAALFERRRVRRYLKPLRALQERLGLLNDAVVGLEAYRDGPVRDPNALFAIGWLAARREALAAQAGPELATFAKVKRFWKR